MMHASRVKGTSRRVMLMMPKMLKPKAMREKRRTAFRLSQQQRTRCPCFCCLMPRSVESRGVGSTMVAIFQGMLRLCLCYYYGQAMAGHATFNYCTISLNDTNTRTLRKDRVTEIVM